MWKIGYIKWNISSFHAWRILNFRHVPFSTAICKDKSQLISFIIQLNFDFDDSGLEVNRQQFNGFYELHGDIRSNAGE